MALKPTSWSCAKSGNTSISAGLVYPRPTGDLPTTRGHVQNRLTSDIRAYGMRPYSVIPISGVSVHHKPLSGSPTTPIFMSEAAP